MCKHHRVFLATRMESKRQTWQMRSRKEAKWVPADRCNERPGRRDGKVFLLAGIWGRSVDLVSCGSVSDESVELGACQKGPREDREDKVE